MTNRLKEIDGFAKSTLGETPKIVELLGILKEEMAEEQFRENSFLYMGRVYTDKKILALIALSVSLANGQKDSAMLHYKLAKKFKADNMEVLDAFRVSKMAVMSSTFSVFPSILPVFGKYNNVKTGNKETEKIMKKVAGDSDMDRLPAKLVALSDVSSDLMNEHIKEKGELLSPYAIDKKFVFLIAYAVSLSLSDTECSSVYLEQYFRNGGTLEGTVDATSVVRFVSGNRVFTTGDEVLSSMITDKEK